MKKLIVSVATFILFGANVVGASPFLVCDPEPWVEWYELIGLPSNITGPTTVPDSTGQYGFKVDLNQLPIGSYTVTARACNTWGCSVDSSPFSFTRTNGVTKPINIKIVK